MDIIFININSNEIDFEEYIKPLEKDGQIYSKEDQKLLVHSRDYGILIWK